MQAMQQLRGHVRDLPATAPRIRGYIPPHNGRDTMGTLLGGAPTSY